MTHLYATPAGPGTPTGGVAARRRRTDAAKLFRATASAATAGPDTADHDHLPLVRALARRYHPRGEPLDDLVQVGSLGLIKAIDRYQPGRGTEFTTYAVPTILGEIGHYLRDRHTTIRIPTRITQLRTRVVKHLDELTQSLGRSPTIQEFATAAQTDVESVIEALEADHISDPLPASPSPTNYPRSSKHPTTNTNWAKTASTSQQAYAPSTGANGTSSTYASSKTKHKKK